MTPGRARPPARARAWPTASSPTSTARPIDLDLARAAVGRRTPPRSAERRVGRRGGRARRRPPGRRLRRGPGRRARRPRGHRPLGRARASRRGRRASSGPCATWACASLTSRRPAPSTAATCCAPVARPTSASAGAPTASASSSWRTHLREFGVRVQAVPVERALHLKSACTALPDGTVVGWGPVVDDKEAFPALRGRARGGRRPRRARWATTTSSWRPAPRARRRRTAAAGTR